MTPTEKLIQVAVDKFAAPRPKMFISVPGVAPKHSRIHQDGEAVLFLPNGQKVRVRTDASGKTTHVDEDEHGHAIVRPDTYHARLYR